MKEQTCILALLLYTSFHPFQVSAFFTIGTPKTTPVPSKIDRSKNPQWLDTLKYPGSPSFNVLEKTIEFANSRTYEEAARFYNEDYVFRGPIIGPITGAEVKRTQQGFSIQDAFPDLETRPFGFTIDPDNPYRCYYMERWEGTNTGSVQIGPITLPPTDEQVQLPTHTMSINWTPQGKVIYTCLSSPLDRWEGTTQGAGAVFGLLKGAGLESSGSVSPGDLALRIQQRFFHALGGFGRNWSVEEEIPAWWKSKARGADPNDI
jgi:hypothetical protein